MNSQHKEAVKAAVKADEMVEVLEEGKKNASHSSSIQVNETVQTLPTTF